MSRPSVCRSPKKSTLRCQYITSPEGRGTYDKKIANSVVYASGKCSDPDLDARGREARRTLHVLWELPHVPVHGAWAQKRAAAYCRARDYGAEREALCRLPVWNSGLGAQSAGSGRGYPHTWASR